jgi:hypothetical protein
MSGTETIPGVTPDTWITFVYALTGDTGRTLRVIAILSAPCLCIALGAGVIVAATAGMKVATPYLVPTATMVANSVLTFVIARRTVKTSRANAGDADKHLARRGHG